MKEKNEPLNASGVPLDDKAFNHKYDNGTEERIPSTQVAMVKIINTQNKPDAKLSPADYDAECQK